MIGKLTQNARNQMQFLTLDELIPKDHMLRQIDEAVDFTFIYKLVVDKYTLDNGRPSLDPVMLIKLPLLQYLCGIKSMRQTIKDVEVNAAYRWFLGLSLLDEVPHFTTFGKNYQRRFAGTDLFEQIFNGILAQAFAADLVDTSEIFIDGTHVKAHANRRKSSSVVIEETGLWYKDALEKEIEVDRKKHQKKPLKPSKRKKVSDSKPKKTSKTDPESGWYHKGEHKEVFAYSEQVACDQHGWALAYTSHPGNEHDSRTVKALFDKLTEKNWSLDKFILDAGYKTPTIAHYLLSQGITPILPYKRPMTKDGFFKKREYVYDEFYDDYICPHNQLLRYVTTDRKGYKLYKSNPKDCENCPLISQCTLSQNHQKIVTRHVYQEAMDSVEDIRYTIGTKAIYDKRKETIERLFGTAKEFHQMRYTNQVGLEKMHVKVGLTLACLNIKKLAKIKKKQGRRALDSWLKFIKFDKLNRKRQAHQIFLVGLSAV